jgi:hypothetical protein
MSMIGQDICFHSKLDLTVHAVLLPRRRSESSGSPLFLKRASRRRAEVWEQEGLLVVKLSGRKPSGPVMVSFFIDIDQRGVGKRHWLSLQIDYNSHLHGEFSCQKY